MPLNPNIALSYKGIELENPLDRYNKFMSIQSAQQQNALAQRQIQQEDELKNYLRSTNLSTPEGRDGLRQFGKVGLAYENALNDQEMNSLKRDELGLKVQERRLSALGTGLTSVLQDPSDANLETAFKQLESVKIDTTPFRQQFAQITDPAQRKAVITQYALTNEVGRKALEFVQPKPEKADLYGQTVWIDTNPNSPTYLKPVQKFEDQPLPAAVEAQKSRIAKAGATSVNVSTDKAYGSAIGKLAAEEDIALHQKAQSIPTEIKKVDETLNVLRNSDINTGIGAEVFTVLDQAKAQFTNDKAAGKRVTDTQYLDSLLGSSVFPQISALGIGARGLDTPAEREFLRKVITGTISLNKDTLIKMTELRRRGLQDAANVYNNKVKSGELDRFFEGTGRSRALIELPEAPASRKPTTVLKAPSGVDSALWNAMTPQERALWQK